MKTPLILVTAALTIAILIAASLLVATGMRGDNTPQNVVTGQATPISMPSVFDADTPAFGRM